MIKPLNMVNSGKKVEIVEIRAGRGLMIKLSEMGLHIGSIIEVVFNSGRGPLIISKNGARFALGAGMAFKIIVKEI